jgi:hypothetical protein
VNAGQTTRFSGASTWRRSEALTSRRHTRRRRVVEADTEDVEEERVSVGVWQGNKRVRVYELGYI